jgi:hypothetical protein
MSLSSNTTNLVTSGDKFLTYLPAYGSNNNNNNNSSLIAKYGRCLVAHFCMRNFLTHTTKQELNKLTIKEARTFVITNEKGIIAEF